MTRLLREERDFRRVFISELISLGGDWFAIIPLLILLPKLTGTGVWGALVLAADTLIFALLSPYAGTVVDRVDRRTLMVVCDIVSAVMVALLLLVRSECRGPAAGSGGRHDRAGEPHRVHGHRPRPQGP